MTETKLKTAGEEEAEEKRAPMRLLLLALALLSTCVAGLRSHRVADRPIAQGGNMPDKNGAMAGLILPKGNNVKSPLNTSPPLTGNAMPYNAMTGPLVANSPAQASARRARIGWPSCARVSDVERRSGSRDHCYCGDR